MAILSVILSNADNDNYAAAGKHQRPVWPLPPTAARRLCFPPHPRSSACYLVRVVLSAALAIQVQLSFRTEFLNLAVPLTVLESVGYKISPFKVA